MEVTKKREEVASDKLLVKGNGGLKMSEVEDVKKQSFINFTYFNGFEYLHMLNLNKYNL